MNVIILTAMNVSINTDKYTKGLASSGGWIGTLIESIKKLERNDRVEVISVSPTNDNSKDSVGNVTCHHLKGRNYTWKPQEELIRKFQEIINDVKPDLIDIQGVEFSLGRDILMCNFDCPVAVTLQGLPDEIAKVYGIGMPKNYKWKNRTFYDWSRFKGEFEKQLFMKKRGETSLEIFRKADYFIGRTDWDHANTWKINNTAKYFCNNRVLRDEFYENKWDIEKIVPHTIFGIQGRDSAKGLHVAVEALALLKNEYPDVKLIVPGGYKYDSPKGKMGGFEKHIRTLIKKHSLEDNIEFTGALTASQMAERMKTSHVFCQYSLLENSPNSLGEAMIMGVPCVASFVGGTSTYMISEVNALAYERSEVGTLAYTIKRIFDDNQLALHLSENAKKDAAVRFSKDNVKSLFEIYDKIYEDTKGKR